MSPAAGHHRAAIALRADAPTVTVHTAELLVIARQWPSIQRLARQIMGVDGDYRPDEIGLYIAGSLRLRAELFQRLMDRARCGPACVAAQVATEIDRCLSAREGRPVQAVRSA